MFYPSASHWATGLVARNKSTRALCRKVHSFFYALSFFQPFCWYHQNGVDYGGRSEELKSLPFLCTVYQLATSAAQSLVALAGSLTPYKGIYS